jgi:hypothetical protein
MEYVQIVTKRLEDGRILASSVVMPKAIGDLLYVMQLISPAQKIMDQFSKTELVNCKSEDFDAETFLLFMQFKSGEIDEEEFYRRRK